ncbi:MAG TPA: glycerophosphodiester phosphodiesterase [Cytophagales bacterium]|nr:glycerophosphodiester phosphodiesterase [Cytophagales bacterium]
MRFFKTLNKNCQNKRLFILLSITSLLLLFSCLDLDSFPDRPYLDNETLMLAHRAGGDKPYGPFPENTYEAAVYGFAHADGIEVDVQKSLNGTLWLFHDSFLLECNGKDKNRIPEKTDEEIRSFMVCKGVEMATLEEILNYHRENSLNKIITLDVKSWLPSKNSYSTSYLTQVADKIAKLVKKYDMADYVIVECETALFLNRIRKNNKKILCYLTTFGDLEEGATKALKAGYAGISFEYDVKNPPSIERIEKVKSKGIKIQFWVINDKKDFERALALKPEFIQTDNVLQQ